MSLMTSSRPTLTIPEGRRAEGDPDPVAEFAAKHIGDAETVEIEVVYVGHETAPDILTVDRDGTVLSARSSDDDA